MHTFHEAVAEWLRGWSARERITQAEIGRVLGVKQQGISNRMAGDTPFTVDELHTIATHWDIDMHQMIGESRGIWAQKSDVLQTVRPGQLGLAAKEGLSRAERQRRIVGDQEDGA